MNRFVDQLRTLGNKLYNSEHFAMAEDAYNQAITLCNTEARLFQNRAQARWILEKLEAALDDAITATNIYPLYEKAWLLQSRLLFQLGRCGMKSERLNILALIRVLEINISNFEAIEELKLQLIFDFYSITHPIQVPAKYFDCSFKPVTDNRIEWQFYRKARSMTIYCS